MGRVLFRGGRIYAPVPDASAILVDGATILWVGPQAAAAALAEPDRVVELDGAWVAPAFVDAHVHAVAAGLAHTGLDLSAARSRDDILAHVARGAAGLASDEIVLGAGWDDTSWPAPGRGLPTAGELDRAAGGRPVYLTRVDLHSALASASLRRAAGLGPLPSVLRGSAHHAVRRQARELVTPGQRRAAAESFLRSAAQRGIASVHDCAGPEIGGQAEVGLVQDAAARAGVEVVSYWGEAGPEGIATAARLGANPGGDIFVDGSLGSHTAALRARYLDADTRGALLLGAEDIAAHLVAATRAGVQAGFHAIGDAALDAVVAGLQAAAAELGEQRIAVARHRVEHGEMALPEHHAVLARLGVVTSVQPGSQARWGVPHGMYARRLGPDRAARLDDYRGLAAAGVVLAFGSDAPVTPADPWAAIRAAVNPANPEHAISARSAFTAHTRGGQRAARRESSGVLRPGFEATLAIWRAAGPLRHERADGRRSAWSTDPRSGAPGLPALEAEPPECVATFLRGRACYDSGLMPETAPNQPETHH